MKGKRRKILVLPKIGFYLRHMHALFEKDLGSFSAPRGHLRFLLLCLTLLHLLTSDALAQSPSDELFQAVRLNDQQAVEAALGAGAQLSAMDEAGMTPADLAVDLGHFRIAHFLLARRKNGAENDPRLTDRGRTALRTPTTPRIERRQAPREGSLPSSDLAQLDIPVKPAIPSASTEPIEDLQLAPLSPPEVGPAGSSVPALDTAEIAPPPAANQREQPILPREEVRDRADAPPSDDSTVLGTLWGGIKNVVTLGGLLGGGDSADQPDELQDQPTTQRQFVSPAERFYTPPGQSSDSAAGRMVDRMRGIVGGEDVPENEFGLPELPVVPPQDDFATLPAEADQPEVSDLDIPGLPAPPVNDIPGIPGETLDIPGLVPPIAQSEPEPGAPGLDIPGLTPPVPPPDGLDIPGLGSEFASPTAPPGIEVPGLPATIEETPSDGLDIPGLGAPGVTASPVLDIPGLPPGLDTPRTAQTVAPLDEVPGIIPPPDASAVLPPGLEPLPGGDPNRLRRPSGLVEPDDPSVLPSPGSAPLAERLRRFDDLLTREPGEVRQRFAAPPVSTAPEKPPVSATQLPDPSATPEDRTDTLSRLRADEARQREQEIRDGETVTSPRLPVIRRDVRPPPPVITTRKEPAERLVERLKTVGRSPYQDEDIHGLPIVRPSVDGQLPRRDVQVSELENTRQSRTDEAIHALARFFRADQEEVAGMQPPEIETTPIPRVIDNLVPENDPSRGRVVDDRLLDLEGVELRNPSVSSSQTNRLDENFIDRLGSVLGPNTRATPSFSGDIPPPEDIDLQQLDIPQDQRRPEVRPDIPDPWTMTIERSGPAGEDQTLGVSTISPTDGTEIRTEDGVVTSMIGRIRDLLGGPPETARVGADLESLDALERQETAEELLSEALRDGTPMALPDQSQWSVTEVETASAPPGVPPQPRPGALTRTSMQDVILSLGESVTLENTLPPQQDGLDPLNECVKKNRGTTLFCVEPIDWPLSLTEAFSVPTILYTGTMAITRYDQGTPSRFHSLFNSEDFEDVVAYYQARYGEPTEIWKRSIAPLAKPRMDNPTVTWRSRSSRDNVITVLEIRKFDDSRGGFPDTTRGAVMLYHNNAASIFPQVSSHELMRLRRTR